MTLAPSLPWLTLVLYLFLGQGTVYDPVQARYQEALASASTEGLDALVRNLDLLSKSSPSSPYAARALETIQSIALLHPGAVPDHEERFQQMKSLAGGNSTLAKSLRRIEILRAYYAAAAEGQPKDAAKTLTDPIFDDSLMALQARADAAFRTGDCSEAERLCHQIIESDAYSPLLAGTYVILGLCDNFRGNVLSAARQFQRAKAISPLPTSLGSTEDFLKSIFRFMRPVPGRIGKLFDEVTVTRIAGGAKLKDPRALIFHDGGFVLADRERILRFTSDGRVIDSKAIPDVLDLAVGRSGKLYHLRKNTLDLGTGKWIRLTLPSAKGKALGKLTSIAVDSRGDVYLLDEKAGLLRGTPDARDALAITPLARIKGRRIRIDSRDNIYVLGWEKRSILILNGDGKVTGRITPGRMAGKESSIEYFALDSLNHIFVLDTGTSTIQIFAVNNAATRLELKKISAIRLDQRDHNKNLRVLATSTSAEIAVTGKNDNHWVIFK